MYLGLTNYLIGWKFVYLLSQYLTIYTFSFFALKFRKKWNYDKIRNTWDDTELLLNEQPRLHFEIQRFNYI